MQNLITLYLQKELDSCVNKLRKFLKKQFVLRLSSFFLQGSFWGSLSKFRKTISFYVLIYNICQTRIHYFWSNFNDFNRYTIRSSRFPEFQWIVLLTSSVLALGNVKLSLVSASFLISIILRWLSGDSGDIVFPDFFKRIPI